MKGAERFRAHYATNAEQVTKRTRRWRKENPVAYRKAKRAADKRYNRKHPEAKARKNRRYLQRYPEKNAARVTAYRARKLKATPAWADVEAIKKIYALARQQKELTGENVHVDHIVPLKSKLVCGLHVPENLRIVIGTYNSRKANRVWPDMP